ncbi:MAG: hypothetical protein SGPRY_002796 [Prymnesium sp.]
MQGEVSLLVNQRWLSKVWYLENGMQLELLIDIASRLKAQVFAPWEFCPAGAMYILHRGTVLWAGRPRAPGSAWGDDVLLPNKKLHLTFAAIAISYLWVFTIDGGQLHAAISKFPESASRLYLISRQWTIRRAVVRHAERQCLAQGSHFRGRLYPIYAKEKAQVITGRRLPEPNRHRGSQCKAPHIFARRISSVPSIRHQEKKPDVKTKRVVSFIPGLRKKGDKAIMKKKSSNRNLAEEETSAAANFGLHLREEQLMANTIERADLHRMTVALAEDVHDLKNDMWEVLRLLRQATGDNTSLRSAGEGTSFQKDKNMRALV